MEVLEEEEEGWWRGRIGNFEGVFPSNFVEEITEEEPPKSQPAQLPAPDLPPPADPHPGDKGELAAGLNMRGYFGPSLCLYSSIHNSICMAILFSIDSGLLFLLRLGLCIRGSCSFQKPLFLKR